MTNALLILGGLAALIVGAAACKGRPAPSAPASKLVDLTSSLDAVRSTFNAHKQESRFLTLLSPA